MTVSARQRSGNVRPNAHCESRLTGRPSGGWGRIVWRLRVRRGRVGRRTASQDTFRSGPVGLRLERNLLRRAAAQGDHFVPCQIRSRHSRCGRPWTTATSSNWVNWANNTVRGYLVGTLRTDGRGVSIPSSSKLYRTGETRGYRLVLTWPSNTYAIGNLWPCGPPPLVRSAVSTAPKVAVAPGTDLVDGGWVKASVTGFGVAQKVYLSECDSAEERMRWDADRSSLHNPSS